MSLVMTDSDFLLKSPFLSTGKGYSTRITFMDIIKTCTYGLILDSGLTISRIRPLRSPGRACVPGQICLSGVRHGGNKTVPL